MLIWTPLCLPRYLLWTSSRLSCGSPTCRDSQTREVVARGWAAESAPGLGPAQVAAPVLEAPLAAVAAGSAQDPEQAQDVALAAEARSVAAAPGAETAQAMEQAALEAAATRAYECKR